MLPSPNELRVRPANQQDEQILAKSLHFVDQARNLIVSYLNHGIVSVSVQLCCMQIIFTFTIALQLLGHFNVVAIMADRPRGWSTPNVSITLP